MDAFVSVFCRNQAIFLPNGIRKKIRNPTFTAVQSLADALPNRVLLEAADEVVNRDDPSGDGNFTGWQFLGFKHGIRKAAMRTSNLHFSVKTICTAAVQLIADITLIEIGNAYLGTVVIGTELHQIKTTADSGKTGLIRNNSGNTDRLAILNQGDRLQAAAVFITARKV